MTDDRKKALNKFFQDPEWHLITDEFSDKINALSDVTVINVDRSDAEIASDVRGRQHSITMMQAFLNEVGIVTPDAPLKKKTSFK